MRGLRASGGRDLVPAPPHPATGVYQSLRLAGPGSSPPIIRFGSQVDIRVLNEVEGEMVAGRIPRVGTLRFAVSVCSAGNFCGHAGAKRIPAVLLGHRGALVRPGPLCRRAAVARRTVPVEPAKNAFVWGSASPAAGDPVRGLQRIVKTCGKLRSHPSLKTHLGSGPQTASAFAPRCRGTHRTRAAPAPVLAARADPRLPPPHLPSCLHSIVSCATTRLS